VLVWKKGIAVLSAGNVKVSPDPRISLVNGYGLEIKEASPQDAGDYVCQIGTLEPREITHTRILIYVCFILLFTLFIPDGFGDEIFKLMSMECSFITPGKAELACFGCVGG
jgi:hypothetical protein